MSFKKFFSLSLILLAVSVAGCTGSFDNLPYNISSTDYANLSGIIEDNLNQLSCVNQTASASSTGSVINGRVKVEISHDLFFNGQNVNSKFMYLIDSKRTPEKFFPKYSDFVPDIFGTYYLYVDTTTGRIYTSPTINITVDEELHDGFFTDSDWRWLYSAVTKCYDYSLVNSNVCSSLSIEKFAESIEGNNYIRDAQCLTDQKNRHWWSQMNLIYDGKVRSDPESSEEATLVVSLHDYEDTLLYYAYFPVDLSGSEDVYLPITLPYFYEGAWLDVYLPNGTQSHSIDVRNFAQCNQNAVCDDNEFFETCPSDCALESQYPQKSNWILYAALAGLIGYGAFKLFGKKKRIVK